MNNKKNAAKAAKNGNQAHAPMTQSEEDFEAKIHTNKFYRMDLCIGHHLNSVRLYYLLEHKLISMNKYIEESSLLSEQFVEKLIAIKESENEQ